MNATVDGPQVVCALETWWCKGRSALAGGLDEHHRHPISLGGSTADGLLTLCPLHHRRQHSAIRAMVETTLAGNDPAALRFSRRFATVEIGLAAAAVAAWDEVGRPPVAGWPCTAAVTR